MWRDSLLRGVGRALVTLFPWASIVAFSKMLRNHVELSPLMEHFGSTSSAEAREQVMQLWREMHEQRLFVEKRDLAMIDSLRARAFPQDRWSQEYEEGKRERAEKAFLAGKSSFS